MRLSAFDYLLLCTWGPDHHECVSSPVARTPSLIPAPLRTLIMVEFIMWMNLEKEEPRDVLWGDYCLFALQGWHTEVFAAPNPPKHQQSMADKCLSPFLIGRMFLREPSWKYSAKLYSGSKNLRSTCSGNIRAVGRSLPLIGWEQSSPVNEEKTKIKMDDGVARFFIRFGGNLFICWLVEGAALSRRPRMR